MNSCSIPQKLIVSGEDEESEGEIDIKMEQTLVVSVNDPSLVSRRVGEAPESDIEADFDSTISSNSVEEPSMSTSTPGWLLGSGWGQFLLPSGILKSSSKLDPSLLRKHRERNKSLRANISEKFLTPLINYNIKKIDKLSQGLSNSQMQIQDTLFQSRISTANLLKLQTEIETFLEQEYLCNLKTIDDVQVDRPNTSPILSIVGPVSLENSSSEP